MRLADCPVFPDEAANALSTDRGLGWRLARQAGPVLRDPGANWVFVVGREVLSPCTGQRPHIHKLPR